MNRIIYISSIIIILITSCKSKIKFKKSNSGLEYYFVSENDTAKSPTIGDALVLNMQIYWDDSLLFDSREISSVYRLQLKDSSSGCLHEGLAMMHLNDSAIFKISAFDFYQITADLPMPNCVKKDDKLYFYVKLMQILTPEDIQREIDRQDRMQLKNEQSLLRDYLRLSEIFIDPTQSGLYYIETKKGTGLKPEIGDSVTVHYEGKLITNQPFDSSIKRNQPFTFLYGDTSLIAGWTEGISYMQQGGVAQLIIPSTLAYGKDGLGSVIPPYSTLIFDIYLLKVKKN